MFVPRHICHSIAFHADRVEYPCHERATYKYGNHCLPTSNACPKQDNRTNQNSDHTGFTDRTGNQPCHHVHTELRSSACRSGHTERSGNRQSIHRLSQTEDTVARYPNGITGHLGRICEEQECASDQCHIKDIHTCTAENLFCEDHRECGSYGKNPQRTVHRNDHRDQDTGNEESFLNLLLLPLSHNELNTQTYHV